MDINSKSRADLKAYFKKNSIPTEGNFADLIDSMINPKNDGIAKSTGTPLSIEAAGAGDGGNEKKALSIYQSFADQNPAWSLSLNPRSNPQDAASARLGFSISDGAGNNRLFIDNNSGNIGVGTVQPVNTLHLNGNSDNFGIVFTNQKNSAGKRGYRVAFDNDRLTFQSADDTGNFAANQLTIIPDTGNVGIGTTDIYNPQGWNKTVDILGKGHARLNVRTDAGVVTSIFSHNTWNGARGVIGTDSNHPLSFATAYTQRMTIDTNGRVGIGTINPDHPLVVYGSQNIALFQTPDTQAYIRLSVNNNINDRVELTNRGGGRLTLWVPGGGDAISIARDGSVTMPGRLGTNGHSPLPRTPGWAGGIHTWDIEAEGTVWSKAGYIAGGGGAGHEFRDIAETYLSDTALESGDVVCLDGDSEKIVLSQKPNDKAVLGVITSSPGLLLGSDPGSGKSDLFPVALCGQVACKVVNENGAIKRGDLLTSSSTPGYAMKAKPIQIDGEEIFRVGTIIGKAISSLEAAQGTIEALVFLM